MESLQRPSDKQGKEESKEPDPKKTFRWTRGGKGSSFDGNHHKGIVLDNLSKG